MRTAYHAPCIISGVERSATRVRSVGLRRATCQRVCGFFGCSRHHAAQHEPGRAYFDCTWKSNWLAPLSATVALSVDCVLNRAGSVFVFVGWLVMESVSVL